MHGRRRRIAFGLVGLIGLLALGGVVRGAAGDDRERRRTPVVEVFENARDAVVSISSTEIITVRSPFGGFFEEFFDMPRRRGFERQHRRQSVGSGVVIHGEGYIVTNAHVVARTNERRVTFVDGREYEAEIVAADQSLDLAILKVDADEPLHTLPLGRSNDLMIGETVIAIGNPLGYQHTVTSGVVSATGRSIQMSESLAFTDLIQTDASINPGNSGGPLLNVLGELIGINSAIRGDAQNIGFAIPVDGLREALPDLLDVERRYGIDSGLTIDYLIRPSVLAVDNGSAAARAGIEVGDRLVAVGGHPVREGIDLDIALINHRPGDSITVELERGGRRYETSFRIDARPAPDGAALSLEKLGLELAPIPDDVAGELGLGRGRGLIVAEVERGGPADAAGIVRLDILIALGRHYVTSLDALGHRLERLDPGDMVRARVLRVEQRRKYQLEGPIRVR